MKNKNQKLKLLRTWEILRQDTDAEHTMSTVQLMERLGEEGIICERKSVYDDIRMLQELDYPVKVKRTRVNEYYVDDRSFSTAELRMLMDSVQAANFLSATMAKGLTNKIAALAGNARGEKLRLNTHFVQAGRRMDNEVTATIETLQRALERKRQIRFRYFDTNVDKSRAYRRRSGGSEWYVANPRCLVCHEGNYYVVCVMDGHDDYAKYRLDRMGDLTVLPNRVELPPWVNRKSVNEYLKGAFGMYSGKTEHVSMLCKNEKNNVDLVLDKFGYDLRLTDRGDGYFSFSTDVQVSPVFFAWLVSMEGKVQLASPHTVREQYRALLKSALADADGVDN